MGLFLVDGTRVTQANVQTTAADDPLVKLSTDLYHRRSYGRNDANPNGTIHTLFAKAGKVMRQSELNALFPDATVASVSPTTGLAAGGTVVTITGQNLDGVTGVTFDGAAGTALTVDSQNQIRVTTPAGVAGPADVALTDDGGPVTAPAAFTYQ